MLLAALAGVAGLPPAASQTVAVTGAAKEGTQVGQEQQQAPRHQAQTALGRVLHQGAEAWQQQQQQQLLLALQLRWTLPLLLASLLLRAAVPREMLQSHHTCAW